MSDKVAMGKPIALIGKKKLDILHTPAVNVQVDKEILDLAGRMLATVRVQRGYAIAANQVGVPINLIVLPVGEAYVNVGYAHDGQETDEGIESCLSLPGKKFSVFRYNRIEWNAVNAVTGEFKFEKLADFTARMWQHETDHLKGLLLSDYAKEVR